MNLINSSIINSKYDAFWEDISPVINNADAKPVLIIASNCEAGSPEDQQLLKMLGACKLNPEQYNVVRITAEKRIAWHQLNEKLKPKIIFLIGVLPAQLGISALFKISEPNNFNEKIWLPAPSLSEQEQYPDLKKQLWTNGMKPIFVDKVYGEL